MAETTEHTDRQPLISVVIAAYNAQDTIAEAVTSVLRQRWENVEAVVVDDGSTDRTAEVVRSLEALSRPGREVRLLQQDNGGVARARNRGIAQARGEFLIFLDADDAFLPGCLERLHQVRQELGGDRVLVSPQGAEVTAGGLDTSRPMRREPLPPFDRQRRVILEHNIGSIASLFPRRFFEEVGVFEDTQRFVEDWELWLRAVYSGWRFHRIEEVLWLVWWSAGSLTSQVEQMAAGEDRALQRLLDGFGERMTPAELEFVRHRLDSGSPQVHIRRFADCLRADDLHGAKQALDLAHELMPSQRRVAVKHAISRAPGGMRVLQHRQRTLDEMVSYDPELGR